MRFLPTEGWKTMGSHKCKAKTVSHSLFQCHANIQKQRSICWKQSNQSWHVFIIIIKMRCWFLSYFICLTRLNVLLAFGRPCQPGQFVCEQWKGLIATIQASLLRHCNRLNISFGVKTLHQSWIHVWTGVLLVSWRPVRTVVSCAIELMHWRQRDVISEVDKRGVTCARRIGKIVPNRRHLYGQIAF